MSRSVAKEYASLRLHMERNGTEMGVNDLWIAAVALEADMTLITSDAAFSRVPSLKLEDWLQP